MTVVPEKLLERLDYALPVSLRHIPRRLRDVAVQEGLRVALAGGVVRDLLRLGFGQINRDDFIADIHDLDLVVEGPPGAKGGAGIGFAYQAIRHLPGEFIVNSAFQTATLKTHDGVTIDIATARREEYAAPGQLPVVDTSGYSIEQDLPRRDFTVNSIALELHPAPGLLLDPLGGAGDILDSSLRVVHGRSFIDDPTRLLRALRYSMRLNYDMEAVTRELYQQAIDDGVLDCLSPERVRHELDCIVNETRWVEIWGVMDLTRITDGLAEPLGGISRGWSLEDAQALDIAIKNQAALLARDGVEPAVLRMGWLLRNVSDANLPGVAERIGLFPRQIQLLHQVRALQQQCSYQLAGELLPSQVVQLLERWPRSVSTAALFLHPADTDSARMARRQLLRYVDTWCEVRPELDGHSLLALGAQAGKSLGELRNHLRYARLDRVINTAEEELEAAKRWLALQREGEAEGSKE